MYLARANQQKTIEELMEELKVGEHAYMDLGIFLKKLSLSSVIIFGL